MPMTGDPFSVVLHAQRMGDCHPELVRACEYHMGSFSLGSVTTEEAAFLWGLTCVLRPSLVVETGTDAGYSGLWIASALKWLGAGKLVTIDLDAGKCLAFQNNVRILGLCGHAEVRIGDSVTVLKTMLDPVDFAFIDGGDRMTELLTVLPLLTPRAVVVMHDTNPNHPLRVGPPFQPQLKALGLTFLNIPSPRGMTLLQKGESVWTK